MNLNSKHVSTVVLLASELHEHRRTEADEIAIHHVLKWLEWKEEVAARRREKKRLLEQEKMKKRMMCPNCNRHTMDQPCYDV